MREVLLSSKNKSLSECLQSTSLRTSPGSGTSICLDTGVETGPLVTGGESGGVGPRRVGSEYGQKGAMLLLG